MSGGRENQQFCITTRIDYKMAKWEMGRGASDVTKSSSQFKKVWSLRALLIYLLHFRSPLYFINKMRTTTAFSAVLLLLPAIGTLSFSPTHTIIRNQRHGYPISIWIPSKNHLSFKDTSSLFMSDLSTAENKEVSSSLVGDDSAYFSLEAQVCNHALQCIQNLVF